MSQSRNARRRAAVGTLLLSALFAVSVTALVLSSPLYLFLSWLGLVLLVVGAANRYSMLNTAVEALSK
jgi:hypothetical protein